jgi:multidrug resistance efflux pump
MAKETYPPEFPSAWHYERHLEDLERDLQGRERRVQELEATPGAHQDEVAQAKAEAAAARENLSRYGSNPKATRPKKAAETR